MARRDLGEGIEAHADEVDRLDPVVVERSEVVGVVAAREDRRVDARVKRLHATIEHLRKIRDRRNTEHGKTRTVERQCSAASGDQLKTSGVESSRKLDNPGLVRDTQ